MIEPTPKPLVLSEDQHQVVGDVRIGAIPILVHEPVLDQIVEFSEQELNRERGGFLIGGYHIDRGPYVEVRHFIRATSTLSHAASLTFTHETWSQLQSELDEKYPGEQVVGWQHTHPGFGVFLSGHDLFIHRHFFDQPWQIAMVVDPRRGEFGFFQWHDGEIVDCGFLWLASSPDSDGLGKADASGQIHEQK